MKKNILITGASSGLGKATAKKLADEGYIVFAGVRKQEDKETLESLSENIKAIYIDVTSDESVQSAYECISKETDSLYALINNAGIALAGPVEYLPIDILKKQFDVNVYGAIRTAQKFLPLMKNTDDSRIINMSSMASYGIFPFISPYCVSKKALDMFFNSLLIESKIPNLKIISIKPGVIKTPIWDKSASESEKNLEYLCEEGKKKYEKEFDFLLKNARKNNEKGHEAFEIANLVSKILKAKKPKLSYNYGFESYFARYFSLLPQKVVNFIIKKGLEKKIDCNIIKESK